VYTHNLHILDSVKDNTPRKEGLTGDDCERIVVSMLLSNILATDAKWTAYE